VVGVASPFLIAAAGGLGLVFGSFATVVAHRVPRRESIVFGRSRCLACGHMLRALENLPVLSFVAQRGRCRHCSARISPRYPLIELVSGLLFALAVWKFGLSVTAVVYAAFFWVLVVLSVIDLDHRLLPNRIVLPALVVGWAGLVVAALATGESDRLVGALMGAALFGGFLYAVTLVYSWVAKSEGMGLGDVKLALVLGTFLGYMGAPGVVLVGMFLSFLVGTLVGLVSIKVTGGDRKTAIPFGPSLAAGTVLAVFVGSPLLEAYLRLGS
jgi:leader peptidase (prepilin peptidase)/N-methyltransferase